MPIIFSLYIKTPFRGIFGLPGTFSYGPVCNELHKVTTMTMIVRTITEVKHNILVRTRGGSSLQLVRIITRSSAHQHTWMSFFNNNFIWPLLNTFTANVNERSVLTHVRIFPIALSAHGPYFYYVVIYQPKKRLCPAAFCMKKKQRVKRRRS